MSQFSSLYRSNNTNNEIISALIENKMINTKNVEKALRSVDRGYYFVPKARQRRSVERMKEMIMIKLINEIGVLESLQLQSGYSFLNIGCGMGYFNTVAGILLGINGVNHGIEDCEGLICLAQEMAENFKLNSAAIDHSEFCEPIFIEGNVFELSPTGYYDRVYCEAAVPLEKYGFMKSLIKIGGILVMSFKGLLVKVIRQDEHLYTTNVIHSLFGKGSKLRIPEPCSLKIVTFPEVKPLTLEKLCRSNIRSFMRQNLIKENPELKMSTMCLNSNTNPHTFVYEGFSLEPADAQGPPIAASNKSIENLMKELVTENMQIISTLSPILFGDDDFLVFPLLNSSSEAAKASQSLTKNCFISDYRFNELSKHLKEEVYSLSIPNQLKHFLNYNRID